MSANAIQVSIALPRLTPERIRELVTMATSALHFQLCREYREQQREVRQRADRIRAGFAIDARWEDGEFDREAIARYLRSAPTASDYEVKVGLGLRHGSAVAAVRAELEGAN